MIIASLVGMDESFLQNVHVRYVWVADEIVWGMRFADVLHELPDGTFLIDYSRFDDVVPASASARGRQFSRRNAERRCQRSGKGWMKIRTRRRARAASLKTPAVSAKLRSQQDCDRNMTRQSVRPPRWNWPGAAR